MPDATYIARIHQALGRLGTNGTANPDASHNKGRLVGEAYLWTEVEKYAKAKKEAAKAAMAPMIGEDEDAAAGTRVAIETPSFSVSVTTSEPVRRFDADWLAKALLAKYKVPLHTTKDLVEQAKQPTKPTVTVKIAER